MKKLIKDPVEGNGVKSRIVNNNIYTFTLPEPKGYAGKPVSIEFFYDEDIIKTYDKNKRRLYFSDEFNPKGSHKSLKNVRYGINPKDGKLKNGSLERLEGNRKIIDSEVTRVVKGKLKSIALSKTNFALNIIKKEKGFDKANFNQFEKVFDIIVKIIRE